MTYEQCCSAYFIKRDNLNNLVLDIKEYSNPIKLIEEYLHDNKFVKVNYSRKGKDAYLGNHLVTILPDGLKRIDELQKKQSLNSKYVFVAMSFSDNMKKAREAIRKAIRNAGYIPRIMDEIEHNNQIVPEMLYEIRQSKFIIAEFTEHKNGVYYEAGYAAGLGKKVIHACKKNDLKKAHFDVKQVNTITWETETELTKNLSKRIKATIE